MLGLLFHRRVHPERDQIRVARPAERALGARRSEHKLTEINIREIIVMAPLMVLILWIGVWPAWILDVINKAVVSLF
jgi:NADH:ubiquinone oxidoreductase subunit 4 (subunit M)